MKRILLMVAFMVFGVTLVASAETQLNTKLYSNKYIDVTVKQPVCIPDATVLQDSVTVQKIQKTKDAVDTTKKNISDLKTLWGVK